MEHREGFIAEGYVREAVPDAKLGSALEVFFISTGTMCGLPGYALSAQIAGALGFSRARTAFVCAGLICCVLAALTSYVGARTRMNLAIMSDHAFGTVGGRIVKTVIAVTLLGWVAVILSVFGTMFGDAISRMYKVEIPAAVIEAIAAAAIATVTLRGVRGLESVGKLIAPTLAILLVWTLYRGCPGASGQLSQSIVPTMGIGAAISAVVGGFIVGILIQPDYARFVRHPTRAGIASGIALGVAFPLILTFTALPVARCGAPNLVAVMVMAGIGSPALVLLALGALIDGGASLYSGSLSLTNEVKRFRLPWVVISAAACGLVLALLHAENYYLPFLSALGVALPPVGALLVLHILTLWRRQASSGITVPLERIRLPAIVAWVGGTVVGYLGMRGVLTLTGIAALDSIGTAAAIWVIAWALAKHER
jgi:cytosine permease